MRIFFIIIASLLLSSCSNMKVAKVDPATGYFKTNSQAVTTVSKAVDLDSMKSLLLIPDEDFVKGQINNIGYFDRMITLKDLETEIVKNNLQEKIPDISGRIGLNKVYKEYSRFLWFRFDTRSVDGKKYAQFILTDPGTLDDVFVAEVELDYMWKGVNDQYTWYPLFNEMIKYIDHNSKTYKK